MATTIKFEFDGMSQERAEKIALAMANLAGETNFAHGWIIRHNV
jgi:hypothetical protein